MLPALFITYVLLGPLVWCGLLVLSGFARVRMGRLLRDRSALPEPAPSLAIFVPARNEAAGIEACVTRLLAQDYPRFTLAVVDDRSSDGTGAILDRLARQHDRLRVTHIDALPAGWLGKNHALHVATRAVDAEWLLLVDSDVKLEPDAARRVVALCASRGYDALSVLPKLEAPSLLERSLLPLLAVAWSGTFMISLTNDDSKPDHAYANGQFFLIRRSNYESVDGHAAVRDEIVEDVALMRRLKQSGAKCRLQLGGALGQTRMHTNWRQLRDGWARIFAGSSGRRVRPVLVTTLLLTFTLVSIPIAIALGMHDTRWLSAGLIHLALVLTLAGWAYRGAGQSVLNVLALPATIPVVIGLLLNALRVCLTGRVGWRGDSVTIRRRG